MAGPADISGNLLLADISGNLLLIVFLLRYEYVVNMLICVHVIICFLLKTLV